MRTAFVRDIIAGADSGEDFARGVGTRGVVVGVRLGESLASARRHSSRDPSHWRFLASDSADLIIKFVLEQIVSHSTNLYRDGANLFEPLQDFSRSSVHILGDSSLHLRGKGAKLLAQVTVDDVLHRRVIRPERHMITSDDR